MTKLFLLAGVLALAGALGAFIFRADKTRVEEPPKLARDVAAKLEREIATTRATVQARAKTLSNVDRIRYALATDAATAADMIGREIQFEPGPGEVIELVQQKGEQKPTSLLVLPPGEGWQLAEAGDRQIISEGAVRIIETVSLKPLGVDPETTSITGYLTVSQLISLAALQSDLAAADVPFRLKLGDESMTSGEVSDEATWVELAQPESGFSFEIPQTTVTERAEGPWALLAGLGGLLIFAAVATRGIAKKDTPREANAQQQNTETAPATTAQLEEDMGEAASKVSADRWERIRLLGSGGMADVHLARAKGEAGFEKLVALKVMHTHLARDEEAVALFLDEARLAARLRHPNIVSILDLGKVGNDYVIIMDYVDGINLHDALLALQAKRRFMPIPIALAILSQVCDGLHAAHQATSPQGEPLGIIHRDVKCGNVLLSKQGEVKIVDFGIAKASDQMHITVDSQIKGTPATMAPEQRVGQAVDARADLYSVAAMAYELLSGQEVNLDLAAYAHLGTENWPPLESLTTLRDEVDPALDRLVFQCMAFAPDDRLPDCAALAAHLESAGKKYDSVPTAKDISRWLQDEVLKTSKQTSLKVSPA